MISMLTDIFGASAANIIFVLAAFAIVILAIIGVMEIFKAMTGRRFGLKKSQEARLSVVDSTPIDRARRLILIKRDGIEHLILIGGPSDVVIEKNIGRGRAKELMHDVYDSTPDETIEKNANDKDTDLTANFDNLLNDSELVYEDAPVNDHLRLADTIGENIEPVADVKNIKKESAKIGIKTDVIKNLLGRHKTKLKKTNLAKEEEAEINKETKQTKTSAKNNEINQPQGPKKTQSAKISPAIARENANHIGKEQDSKINRVPPAKAFRQESTNDYIENEPTTMQQAARDRIVHEIENVVEDAKETNSIHEARKIESDIVAKAGAETRNGFAENSPSNLQMKSQYLQAESTDEQSYINENDQRQTLQPNTQISRKEDSVRRLYKETEPARATVYHAPVEKMPIIEPIEEPKKPSSHSLNEATNSTSSGQRMQPHQNYTQQPRAQTPSASIHAHAPMVAGTTNQATALKIEEEEDYLQNSNLLNEEISDELLEQSDYYDFSEEFEQNKNYSARRHPANKKAEISEVKPQRSSQRENVSQNMNNEVEIENLTADRMIQANLAAQKSNRHMEARHNAAPAPVSKKRMRNDDMHITAPTYEMENFGQGNAQTGKSFELKNDYILTQNSVYYTPVENAQGLDMEDEYYEPIEQARVKPALGKKMTKEASANAEIENHLDKRYRHEVAMQEEFMNGYNDMDDEFVEDLDDEFDAMFEDELRQVVKTDK